jgi:hypothetical protein
LNIGIDLILFLSLWGCGHRGRVFACGTGDARKSTGSGREIAHIDRAEELVAELNAEQPVLVGRPQCDRLAAKRFAQPPASAGVIYS